MRGVGWFLGGGTTLMLLVGLAGTILLFGGAPFSPGPLSAEHPLDRPLSGMASHADFEAQCDLCHTPFRGADGSRCTNCHSDIAGELASPRGLHGTLPEPQNCATCHPDHKGREASLTRTSLAGLPHNQFGFALASHQRGYDGEPLGCSSCHTVPAQGSKNASAAVLAACVDCHRLRDARFIADHRATMGVACLACHDGTDRLKDFDHAAVFPLQLQHSRVACVKCHVNNRYRGTPRDCVQCHPDPTVHRGQFGVYCAACHTAAGWRPARLVRHTFPLGHGLKGKESACKTCHPTNYAAYTCYGCHDHTQAKMTQVHAKQRVQNLQNCAKCHPTGKEDD